MFLAAGPYFQVRFADSDWLLTNFQSGELSTFTVTNLVTMVILTKKQSGASYPGRIIMALLINMGAFTLLALSTKIFTHISPGAYFAFMLAMVFCASFACGCCQNGAFAFASSLGREEYMQGIMTGQAVAGVLPALAQIVLTLSVSDDGKEGSSGSGASNSAFAYFMTATGVSVGTLIAFLYLRKRQRRTTSFRKRQTPHLVERDDASLDEPGPLSSSAVSAVAARRYVPLTLLFRKLLPLALAVFITFLITMVFPVFTQQILSVSDPTSAGPLQRKAVFIPLAFLFWNIGDFFGRVSSGFATLRAPLVAKPYTLLILSVARVMFIPLYMGCNIDGRGGWISSDVVYLLFVQLPFGFTNGFIGSSCMMGATEWVDVDEREATGGFMGMCLVAGLAAGSLLSFVVAGA